MPRLRTMFAAFAILLALGANGRSDQNGIVVSVDPHGSKAGVSILESGGNAVDAAVATAFALAVVHPEAGNIGGGGFLLAWINPSRRSFVVDYRETAPKLARPDMFLDDQGQIDPDKVDIGWLTVGVPGTVHGLWQAHKQAGTRPWSELVQPAIDLARDGFIVDDTLAKSLQSQEEVFKRFEEPARLYFPNGVPPTAGQRLKLPVLAATLESIRDHGPDAFYRGETADRIDRAMRDSDGLVRLSDLNNYQSVLREPVRGTYRGYEILSAGPPSSGGVVLIQALNILECVDLRASGNANPKTLHWMIEAMRRAFYDRARFLGDPDFVSMPLAKLLSKQYARDCHAGIQPTATSSESFGEAILTPKESEDTTHFSVIDSDGNVVSNTYTLEGAFGAKVAAPGTGFLLNNEMHDFNVKPGLTDHLGHIGTPPNRIAPGKRMLSSQTPTLVLKDGKPVLVLGSPGGRTIPNTVLQVIVNVIDHRMSIADAVRAPRLHHQWMPDTVYLEEAFDPSVASALEAMGHHVQRRKSQGDCHAIWIDPKTGRREAGVDDRIRGSAQFERPDQPAAVPADP